MAVLLFVPRDLGVVRHPSPKPAQESLYSDGAPKPRTRCAELAYVSVLRSHGWPALKVAVYGSMPIITGRAYLGFILPLRLAAAGVDPAMINVLDSYNYVLSMPLLFVSRHMLDNWRYGLRIVAACYSGFRGLVCIAFCLAGPEMWQFWAASTLFPFSAACGPAVPLVTVALAPKELTGEFIGLCAMMEDLATM